MEEGVTVSDNYRVLAVDDDRMVLDNYRSIFQSKGDVLNTLEQFLDNFSEQEASVPRAIFQLDTADSGQDAVELARHRKESGIPFAVAFVDMRMPNGLDGLETSKQLRALDDSLYIVIVSAYSDHDFESIREELDQRVIYISKPFDREVIKQVAYHHCHSWKRDRMLDTLMLQREQQIQQHEQTFELYRNTSHAIKHSLDYLGDLTREVAQLKSSGGDLDHFLTTEKLQTIDDKIDQVCWLMNASLESADQQAIENIELPISESLTKIVALFKATRAGHLSRVELKLDIPHTTTVYMSYFQLQAMLMNLLNNTVELYDIKNNIEDSDLSSETQLRINVQCALEPEALLISLECSAPSVAQTEIGQRADLEKVVAGTRSVVEQVGGRLSDTVSEHSLLFAIRLPLTNETFTFDAENFE